MYDIRTTADFDKWLRKLKDRQAVKAIVLRLTRAEAGNLGDIKSVGG
jgi:putative addiction module killer protein